MAPELILALVEDEGIPQVTTYSDVYAFAAVCLEVSTIVTLAYSLDFFYNQPFSLS